MQIRTLFTSICLLTCVVWLHQPLYAQATDSAERVRRISVTGTAIIQAEPDIAYVTVGARSRMREAEEAAKQNAAVLQRIITAIRELGISANDIKTVQYTLQPAYEYPPNASPKLVGYDAVNLVRVTVRDLKRVGNVIDVAAKAGANDIRDVEFSLRDEKQAKIEALKLAVNDGRAKAEAIAGALKIGLGPIMNATESGGVAITPLYARAEGAAPGGTPIVPGQIDIRATVNLVYSISQ